MIMKRILVLALAALLSGVAYAQGTVTTRSYKLADFTDNLRRNISMRIC